MFDALKKALADFEYEKDKQGKPKQILAFTDEPTRILVTVVNYTKKFNDIRDILGNYNAEYHPFQKEGKRPAYWVIQKGRTAVARNFEDKPVVIKVAEGLEYEASVLLKMAKDLRSLTQ